MFPSIVTLELIRARLILQENRNLFRPLLRRKLMVWRALKTAPLHGFPANLGRDAQKSDCTNDEIGQDSGDVVAIMAEGYNFDGIQPVARLGDPVYNSATSVFSVPNFYGSHGHDSTLLSMSASFLAAGPDIRHTTVSLVHNIDVAPTIMHILGVEPAETVDGRVLSEILRR
jgi:hypothetical protein